MSKAIHQVIALRNRWRTTYSPKDYRSYIAAREALSQVDCERFTAWLYAAQDRECAEVAKAAS